MSPFGSFLRLSNWPPGLRLRTKKKKKKLKLADNKLWFWCMCSQSSHYCTINLFGVVEDYSCLLHLSLCCDGREWVICFQSWTHVLLGKSCRCENSLGLFIRLCLWSKNKLKQKHNWQLHHLCWHLCSWPSFHSFWS